MITVTEIIAVTITITTRTTVIKKVVNTVTNCKWFTMDDTETEVPFELDEIGDNSSSTLDYPFSNGGGEVYARSTSTKT